MKRTIAIVLFVCMALAGCGKPYHPWTGVVKRHTTNVHGLSTITDFDLAIQSDPDGRVYIRTVSEASFGACDDGSHVTVTGGPYSYDAVQCG